MFDHVIIILNSILLNNTLIVVVSIRYIYKQPNFRIIRCLN